MNHPTSRLAGSEASSGLPADIFGEFSADPRTAGPCAEHARRLRRGARQFPIRLDLRRIAVGSVDGAAPCAFRRRDCQCPGTEGERRKAFASDERAFPAGASRLIQFVEDRGDAAHPGELEVSLRHLDDFFARCGEEGYGPEGIRNCRSGCRSFPIWPHRPRIPIADVDAGTPERFRQHDCVCPGMRGNSHRRRARPVSRVRSFLHHLN